MTLKYEGIIFDLDMTLVDSRCVAHHRARGQWQKTLSKVPQIIVYAGISELTAAIAKRRIPTAIVTNGRRDYCNKVIAHCRLPIKVSVAYQDTRLHKPDPEPMLKAASLLGLNPENIVVIGDRNEDVIAANNAKMISVAATWACTSAILINEAGPKYQCKSVDELAKLLEFN